jgi:DNA-binding PadR family transcriptional regulator
MKGYEMAEKDMTGYKLAKEVNKRLEELSLATIKPQMVYNYINSNLIPSYVSESGQRLVKLEDAMKWIEKYASAKKSRQNA